MAKSRVRGRDKAQQVGRAMCAAMRDKLGRQMFEVAIQAAASGKVVARETLKVCLEPAPACSALIRRCLSAGCVDRVAVDTAQSVSAHLHATGWEVGKLSFLLPSKKLCTACLTVVDAREGWRVLVPC